MATPAVGFHAAVTLRGNVRPHMVSTRDCCSMLTEAERADAEDVWQFRTDFMRSTYGAVVDWKEDERAGQSKRAERRESGKTASGEASKSAFTASVGAVLVGVLVIRLGGRAALVSVLGLDLVAELGIGDQIDQVLQYADQAGGWTVLVFILGWVFAKVFLIDFVSLALAFSSGVLFGGVIEGALISATGATLGSLIALGLSRSLLQEKVEGFISKRPVARALAKVVEEDGFKTVVVLRLSPILPIPTGAYPYIYGTSKLQPLTFAAAYFLGSLKPYLLDSYLGVFSKQIIDGASLDSSRDLILLAGLGALVLVGVFATELANDSWDLVQKEVALDAERRKEEELNGTIVSSDEDQSKAGMVGPLNTTALAASAAELVPQSARDDFSDVWRELNAFCDAQWAPAVERAASARMAQQEQEARVQRALDNARGNMTIGNALVQLANEREATPQRADDELPTAAQLAERTRMTEWALAQQSTWRQLLSASLFNVALAGAARRRWVEFSPSELDVLLTDVQAKTQAEAKAKAEAQAATLAATQPATQAKEQAAREARETATTLVDLSLPTSSVVGTSASAIALRQREIDERQREIEAQLERLETAVIGTNASAIKLRQREIDERQREIEAQLERLGGD